MKKISPPVLQIALDFISLSDAINIADKVHEFVDWIECGTPLIKSEGKRAIKALRDRFPEKIIVADMKTIDTGKLEAELAFSSGADVISVLAVADDKTIIDAIDVAHSYGGFVMADLIGHPSPDTRIKELSKLGVDIVLYHIGIDQQARMIFPVKVVDFLRKNTSTFFAVAGGLNDKTAEDVTRRGADIVIVGRFITRASNPRANAQKVKMAIERGYRKS